MRKIASISVSALALATALSAAPANATGFSGFYAGLQLGDTFGDASSSQNLDTGGPFSIPQADYKFNALSGGAHVGYNHQFDNFIFGAAFSMDLTDMGGSDNQTSTDKFGFVYVDADPDPNIVTLVPTTRLDLNGDRNSLTFDTIYAIEAKGGWMALPGTLLYATGGWAWASADATVDFSVVDTTNGPGPGGGLTMGTVSTSEGRSVTFSGFTYGLGADFQMTDSTTIGFQWRHLNLDKNEATFVQPGNRYQVRFDPNLDTVQIKASYFFMGMIN